MEGFKIKNVRYYHTILGIVWSIFVLWGLFNTNHSMGFFVIGISFIGVMIGVEVFLPPKSEETKMNTKMNI